MSELRQDPTTYDWVIIAKERARRPEEFKNEKKPKEHLPDYSKYCPFCPGNEERTPRAEAVYGDHDQWKIRVIPNKFPALTPDGTMEREEHKLFRKTHGYGRHEVIVETPLHNELLPFMTNERIEELMKVYRDRYRALKGDPGIKVIIIFKNHGRRAGTSLVHPHTQIVASPIVPPFIRRKFEIATHYFDNVGKCIHIELERAEREDGTRVVADTTHFTAIHPFASHYPFETWIMPKVHKPSFSGISEEEIRDLARILKEILLKLHAGLENPDYNLIVNSSPVDDENKSYYHWHIQIIPRLIEVAGFELGSGIYINSVLPEETAAFMRGIKV
ncbi:MAG: galactose-1-phosphate uridylyltransferase [Thermodesulfovibrionales bacterium]